MRGLWLAAMLGVGCGGPDGADFCDEQTPCGFGETCVENACKAAGCNTSRDCPMEETCGPGRTCVAGCVDNSDCYPGDLCDLASRSCEAKACTDANLDCAFGEFCDQAGGDCYAAGEQYCRPCTQDYQCGDGNVCYNRICGVDCSAGQECPTGYSCLEFTNESGQVVAYNCHPLNCSLYDPDYVPTSAVTSPSRPLPGAPVRLPSAEVAP